MERGIKWQGDEGGEGRGGNVIDGRQIIFLVAYIERAGPRDMNERPIMA